ncbi:hypothetical protein B0H13DRAFT_2343840 [Mycena leptocephala]|nr:hypothetical protein B0H13DRAFT_2343840 [Mycena leptocephala]
METSDPGRCEALDSSPPLQAGVCTPLLPRGLGGCYCSAHAAFTGLEWRRHEEDEDARFRAHPRAEPNYYGRHNVPASTAEDAELSPLMTERMREAKIIKSRLAEQRLATAALESRLSRRPLPAKPRKLLSYLGTRGPRGVAHIEGGRKIASSQLPQKLLQSDDC